MLSEFQRQKVMDLFEVMDDNGDGVVALEDIQGHVHRLQKQLGWSNDDHRVLRVLQAKRAFWDALRTAVDKDDSHTLSEEEWVEFFDETTSEIRESGKAPEWLFAIHHAIFESMDTDGDGGIQFDEYEQHIISLGVDHDPKPAFERADLNGDGQISIDELDDLMMQWLMSDEPGDRGNSFLTGRIFG